MQHNLLPGSLSPFTPPTVVSASISQILPPLAMTAAVNCPGSTQVSLFFACRLVLILPRRNLPLTPSLGEYPVFCCPIHPHPCQATLHVDTNVRSSTVSVSPISSAAADTPALQPDHSALASRRSSDSTRTMPRLSVPHRERSSQERSMSMSTATAPSSSRTKLDQKRTIRPFPSTEHPGRLSANPPPPPSKQQRKTPVVYPALLSRVSEAFRDRIPLADRLKDGLTYKDAFDGREAVDKIAYIIKTTDRNLALLLGRALDAQKFFHDVTYDHRLRDSPNELYQFRTNLGPYVSGELAAQALQNDDSVRFPPTVMRFPHTLLGLTRQPNSTTRRHPRTRKSPSALGRLYPPDRLLFPHMLQRPAVLQHSMSAPLGAASQAQHETSTWTLQANQQRELD